VALARLEAQISPIDRMGVERRGLLPSGVLDARPDIMAAAAVPVSSMSDPIRGSGRVSATRRRLAKAGDRACRRFVK